MNIQANMHLRSELTIVTNKPTKAVIKVMPVQEIRSETTGNPLKRGLTCSCGVCRHCVYVDNLLRIRGV